MRAVVVGMGVQVKRKINFERICLFKDKFIKSDFKNLSDVPKKHCNTVFACVPDKEKIKIIKYCENKKHILMKTNFIQK